MRKSQFGGSRVVQQARDSALSQQWLGSLLWCGFDSWPRNFCLLWVQPEKEKKKGKRKKKMSVQMNQPRKGTFNNGVNAKTMGEVGGVCSLKMCLFQ